MSIRSILLVSRSIPSQIVFTNIFNKLVKWKDPTLSEIVPDLAESWTNSEDGLVWTFTLREGVMFSDGTPFDAEAVKYNLDRIVDPELGSPNSSQLEAIREVKVIDPLTVEITTSEPSPTLLEKLAEMYASINSPSAIKKNPKGYAQRPVGTGPYVLAQWTPGDRVTLERNPDYFGTPGIPRHHDVPSGARRRCSYHRAADRKR